MYLNYIFDLYGTLVDIHTNERKPYLWKKLALFMGMSGVVYTGPELKRCYEELVRCQKEVVLKKAIKEKSDAESEDVEILLEDVFYKLYQKKGMEPTSQQVADTGIFFRTLSLEYICLFEGAEQLLDNLRADGKNVYLLSNAQRIFTEPEMRLLGIYDKFDGILYSSDVGYKKPSLYFYEALFERYNLKKVESVMIGNDSVADIRGAEQFGIHSMYIHTAQSPELRGELPDNCRRLGSIREVY